MPETRPLLEARSLVAGYLPGVPILNNCSLSLFEGEISGIVGPNGAGKSTLLKAAFGLVEVWQGDVLLRGRSILGLKPHSLVTEGIGYVPQTDNVFPRLSVRENLEMGLFLEPRGWEERFETVAALFPLLAERSGQRAGALSGGERQMLAMGRALMMNPSVLLLDEPSAGLSPRYQEQVFEQVLEVNRAGVSVLMVEQNARRCLQVAHRGYVLDQGRNAYTGPGEELLNDERVVELYLGSLSARARD
ncbi:MAG: ABC transporter ATP-binding protein [Chloroflexota bacterium]|nr:ABC transporter ATP-binding protein [Chloroflexota bacterium]